MLRASLALLTLLVEIRYTLSRLTAAKVLPASLTTFQTLRDSWNAVLAKDIALHEQLSDALAQVDAADDALDDFAARFQQAVLAITKQDREAPLYQHFFKKSLSELIRPVLSGQLVTMEGWVKSLEEPTTAPTLAAMLPELLTLVADGKSAAAQRDETKLKIKQFREVGERRQLLDQVNAERKALYGALSKLALANGWPTDYPKGFFKPGETPEDESEETIDSLDAEIKQMEAALLAKKERRAELVKEAEDAAAKAQEKATKEAELAAMKKEIDAKVKAAKELEDQLKDK